MLFVIKYNYEVDLFTFITVLALYYYTINDVL